ncbi:MAG: DUF3365 domain-containing protein [Proteobacteria bacterium]|nr:DUF3365 domain-containing protein [Pseudomonadota bacterium]MBU1709043.1 DUF3365 domain-containing protein [Pseudomonadota bacterium]
MAMALGWSIIVVASLVWNLKLYTAENLQIALNVARTHLEKDLLYRKWNTQHGGVYVPITTKTPPNPYMDDQPNRDIKTSDGQSLTLMNPAYMTRQVYELGMVKHQVDGHITSLNPLRPENIADPWEAEALRAFEAGAKEFHAVTKFNDKDVMRLMIPLRTEEDCLSCHAEQGYDEGDIRGGISVTVPMEPFWTAKQQTTRNIWTGHVLFWLLGLLGAGLNFISLNKRIAERKDSEIALENSEARFRELFDRMSSGVAVFNAINNAEDFIFVDINKASEHIERLSREEVIGKSVVEVFPSIKEFGLFEVLQKVWRTGETAQHGAKEYKDNRIRGWRENFVYKLPSGEVVSIYRDMTRAKLAEENLQQAQKMEAIGTLAGGVAHDFNNILTAIIGYAELSLISTPQESNIHGHLEKIVKSGKRATDLVKQILTFSRQTDQERRVLLLQPAIKEALKLLRGTLPTTIEIHQEIETDCDPVLADVTQIHQVIMNLCTNAYHAMREKGGVLSVKLKEVKFDENHPSKHPELGPGKYAQISVRDTGHGMDKETLLRIFDPYFTTKKHGEGTGLGLATVHGIIKNHEGVIDVVSAPDKGTTFTLYFPIVEDKNRYEHIITSKPSLSKIAGRILLVDDEESISQLGEKILRLIGCNVSAFTDSLEAFEAFKAEPDNFDIIMTDQTMPGLTGIELSRKILEMRPDIPIILCTGFSEIVNEQQAKEQGVAEFIMKPLTIHSITEAVRRAQQKIKA